MTALGLLAAGLAAAVIALRASGGMLGHQTLVRANFRGRSLPTAAGLCLVLAVLAVEAVRTVIDPSTMSPRLLVLFAVIGFGLLGLVDDVLGDGGDRGMRGHIAAAMRGRLTTGFVKLAGGTALGVVLAAGAVGGGIARTLVDGALIALAANLGNLFDRAPGRTAKWGLLAAVPLMAVAGTGEVAAAIAPVVGAVIGLLPGDLRERYMLGDTGANAFGAALGMTAVLALGADARTIVAGVLLAMNLASERISFSRVIDAVPPLRAFDRAGRVAP